VVTVAGVQIVEAGVGVALERAREVLQMLSRALATPIRRVPKQHRGGIAAACRTAIPHGHPPSSRLGLAASRFEHRYRRTVGMQLGGPDHVTAQGVDERIEQMEALPHPLGECGTFQLDVFARIACREILDVLRLAGVRPGG